MSLPGVCPHCHGKFEITLAIADTEAREAMAAAIAAWPLVGRQVVKYLALHSPLGRAIAWPKLTRLVRELSAALEAEQVSRHGQTQPCPLAIWAQALDKVLDKDADGTLRRPLGGHGLLFEVAFGLASQPPAAQQPARSAASARGETSIGFHASHTQGLPPERTAADREAECVAWKRQMRALGQTLTPSADQVAAVRKAVEAGGATAALGGGPDGPGLHRHEKLAPKPQ